jgi:gamma-glutamyltranspeptidase / glutathione hydrolase
LSSNKRAYNLQSGSKISLLQHPETVPGVVVFDERSDMTHGIVCAPQPEAVEAGALVLKSGGNAVDAAIACALVQTVVDPQMCGIAGFGSMHLYLKDRGEHLLIDFHGRAPLMVKEDMWEDLIVGEAEDGFGFVLKGQINELGYGSITTPMSLKAYDEALKRYGTKTLAELLQPAIEYAENGFMVRPHVAHFWNQVENTGRVLHMKYLTEDPSSRKIYVKENGKVREAGEILKNPDLAKTYRIIAEQGADAFYQGEIADAIVSDMETNGGLITKEDLKAVDVSTTDPLWTEYRGYRIATNQPPGGGIMLVEMLNILENFDLAAMGHNSSDYLAVISEAMKIATVDKDNHIGDPKFVDIPVERLTSKDYAREQADRIKRGEITRVPRMKISEESKDTTHVCTSDEAGNMVSMTHSLGMPSGTVTEGLGFMYNGCMGVFDPRPGKPGSLAPGKSRFTAMCPTMVFDGDKPKLIIGAPGGTYITMGVLQGVLNAIDFGMDAAQAVAAPRICTTSDIIDITNRIPRFVEKELTEKGYQVRRSPQSFYFAGVHAISFDENGKGAGGADPGRDGMALEV